MSSARGKAGGGGGRRARGTKRSLAAGGFATLLMGVLSVLGAFDALEESTEGAMMKWVGPRPLADDLRIIKLDERTFRSVGQTVALSLHARVLGALDAAGAKAVGYDVFFTVPDHRERGAGNRAFAAAIDRYGRAVLAANCSTEPGGDAKSLVPILFESSWRARKLPVFACPSMVPPHGALGKAPFGQVKVAPSAYGPANAVRLFATHGKSGPPIPHLVLALYLRGEGMTRADVIVEHSGVTLGELSVLADPDGTARFSHRVWNEEDHISFGELVAALQPGDPPRFRPEVARRFENAYVLVGWTAHRVGERGRIITGPRKPFLAIHAAFLSDLIEGIPQSGAPNELRVLLWLVGGILMTLAVVFLRARYSVVALVAAQVAAVFACRAAISGGYIVGPFGLVTGSLLAFAVTLVARRLIEEREHRVVTDAFADYVDPGVLEQVLERPDEFLALSGAKRVLTLLMVDIQGYTGMSNEFPPETVVSFVRELMGALTKKVTAREGRVDKIMGDGMLAVFGDPIPHEDHAIRAVDVGLEMQVAAMKLAQKWDDQGLGGASIRVGIATGEVFVGNVGAPGAKLEYTVLGPAVNLAARLEGQADPGSVYVADETKRDCEGFFDFEEVPGLQLKGYATEYRAWRVVPKPE